MEMPEFFEGVSERLRSSAHVKTVYGDPIQVEGKTVVPVAKIAYGFGGGSGKRRLDEQECGKQEGGGGGGGVRATPLGVVEITPGATRFIAFSLNQKLAAAALIGFLAGRVFGRR